MSRVFKKYSIDEFANYIATVPITRIITNVQIHHTFLPTLKQYNASSNKHYIIWCMWNYHVNSRKFSDIAQHFTIAPDGVWGGRALNMTSGGFLGKENNGGICVEIIGNYDIGNESFSGAIAENTYKAVAAILKRFPDADIRFHREQASALANHKTCPGTSIDKTAFTRACTISGMRFIVSKVSLSTPDAWVVNADNNKALREVAEVISNNWEELAKTKFFGTFLSKVGDAIGDG